MSNQGKKVRVHYIGTLNDGSKFDSSYDRDQPLEFVCGGGMMIKGFDAAVENMEAGQVVDVHLMPEEAYGMPVPENILTIAIADMPGAENCEIGTQVYLQTPDGNSIPVRVTEKDETSITFDANHELAGKELNFKIKLVEIVED